MAQSTPDTVVYVSNAASKEIYILAMNRDNGDLTLLDMVSVPGTDKPSPSSMPMAVTPDHRFLYAALRSDSFPASSFAIDHANGRLTHLATTRLQDSMAYIVTDRTGRYLLSASYPGNKLTINPINDKGHIVEQATRIGPRRTAFSSIPPTSMSMQRASARTSSWSGSSIRRPADCRRSVRA
jgi:6-phosphogluconolactonase